jgi:hypothetical protein
MTVIADALKDGALVSAGGTVRFTPAALRDASGSTAMIAPKIVQVAVHPTTGAFTATLDPGVYDVRVKAGAVTPATEVRIEVPDSGSTLRLWPLVESYIPQPAAVVDAATAAKEAAETAADRAEAVADVQDEAIAEVVAAGETKAVLDATYVRAAQARVALDTDGVPFFDPAGIPGNSYAVAADTDGAPYILIGG